MFYFNFVKRVLVEDPTGHASARYVDKVYHYTARYYTHTEFGEFQLYGFNGSDEDVVIWVNEHNYKKVFVMNNDGKTIDSFFANYSTDPENGEDLPLLAVGHPRSI